MVRTVVIRKTGELVLPRETLEESRMIAGTELGCVDELLDDNPHGNKMYQS